MKVLIGVTVRDGRKIVKSANLEKKQVLDLLVSAFQYDVSKAMLAMPTLKRGEKFKYKHAGYNITLEPLHNHIDNY